MVIILASLSFQTNGRVFFFVQSDAAAPETPVLPPCLQRKCGHIFFVCHGRHWNKLIMISTDFYRFLQLGQLPMVSAEWLCLSAEPMELWCSSHSESPGRDEADWRRLMSDVVSIWGNCVYNIYIYIYTYIWLYVHIYIYTHTEYGIVTRICVYVFSMYIYIYWI